MIRSLCFIFNHLFLLLSLACGICRDLRVLNVVTLPYINPATIVSLIVSGDLKKQAAAFAAAAGFSDKSEPLLSHNLLSRKPLQSSGVSVQSRKYVGSDTSPSFRRAILSLRPRVNLLDDEVPTGSSSNLTTVAAASGASSPGVALHPLGAAGKASLAGPVPPKTGFGGRIGGATSLRPGRSSTTDAKSAAAAAKEEMDRSGFLDAIVLAAAGLWEVTKGDSKSLTPGSLRMHSVSSVSHGGGGGLVSPGALGDMGKFKGGPPSPRAAGVSLFSASGSGTQQPTVASLASNKLPSVRAHMVSHFLANYIVPRSKRVQSSSGLRNELVGHKVAGLIMREVSASSSCRYVQLPYVTVHCIQRTRRLSASGSTVRCKRLLVD